MATGTISNLNTSVTLVLAKHLEVRAAYVNGDFGGPVRSDKASLSSWVACALNGIIPQNQQLVAETSLVCDAVAHRRWMVQRMPLEINMCSTQRTIRQLDQFRPPPVIFAAANAVVEDHEKCILSGALGYIPKPVDLDQLFSLLCVWLPRWATSAVVLSNWGFGRGWGKCSRLGQE